MSETTTIQITHEQREALRDVNDASAKAALGDLLESYEGDDSTMTEDEIEAFHENAFWNSGDGLVMDVDEASIAEAIVADLRAELPGAVADEVEGRLR